jgi:hypothetical protein
MNKFASFLLVGAGLLRLGNAQYFPPTPENVTVVQSQLQNGVSISFKEVRALISSSFPSSEIAPRALAIGLNDFSQASARLHLESSHTLVMYTYLLVS